MIYRVTPRDEGRQIVVLLRAGATRSTMRLCGALGFTKDEYRLFVSTMNQGAAMLSPDVEIQIDAMGVQ